MSKKISEIYTEYKIMKSLQEHMLRVAAVAYLICDNFSEPLNKEEIITACLLHDMGNIIKSKLEYFPEFLRPEGLEYWQGVQNEYINKYGQDEHEATVQIMKELSAPTSYIKLVEQIGFPLLCTNAIINNFSNKIVTYADMRVDPHGVVSYDERINEAKVRYEGREQLLPGGEAREKLIACGKDIEKQIFAKCKIKPEDINNDTIAPIISKLRDFVIK